MALGLGNYSAMAGFVRRERQKALRGRAFACMLWRLLGRSRRSCFSLGRSLLVRLDDLLGHRGGGRGGFCGGLGICSRGLGRIGSERGEGKQAGEQGGQNLGHFIFLH